jgi:hypothetical protein
MVKKNLYKLAVGLIVTALFSCDMFVQNHFVGTWETVYVQPEGGRDFYYVRTYTFEENMTGTYTYKAYAGTKLDEEQLAYDELYSFTYTYDEKTKELTLNIKFEDGSYPWVYDYDFSSRYKILYLTRNNDSHPYEKK